MAVSILAFLVGFVALANCFHVFEPSQYGRSFYLEATILCVVSLTLCLVALVNLIRAERRGYSSQRCQLSVVILFFAFVGPILLSVQLVNYYLRR
jgi:uncharacterized membrane protein YidH (DUF202 family)